MDILAFAIGAGYLVVGAAIIMLLHPKPGELSREEVFVYVAGLLAGIVALFLAYIPS